MRHLNLHRHAMRDKLERLRAAVHGNRRRLLVFGLLLQTPTLFGQILLHDNFMQDSSLNQTLWSTGNGTIEAVAQHLTGTLVPPQIGFSNSGMTMSGVAKDSQFTGVVSNQNFTPPFAIEFTVNGVVANGNAFWFHMVDSDLSHYLTVYGNVNPQNVPYYALGAESNQASKVLSASPAENVWYTVVLAVDSSGNASASLQDATGKLLGSTAVGNIGLGPFYLVLGQYEGLPTTVGPNTCTWGQIQVSAACVSGWQLVWSDEFNEAAGTPPNPKNWDYDLGVGKDLWDNSEIDNDTDSPNNVFQDGNGHLVLQAAGDSSGNYTSARLQTGSAKASTSTANLSWQYGLIEARIKIPSSQGVWLSLPDVGWGPGVFRLARRR